MKQKQNTLEKILAAAVDEFADRGYMGARMDEIAKRAGVNKASIYYNIGNKETLYVAILTKIFKDAFQDSHHHLDPAGSSTEKLEIYIRMFARALHKNSQIPRIMMWEHASGGQSFPESVFENIIQMLTILSSILREGEKADEFEKTDTLTIQFMIMGALMFHKTSASIRDKHAAHLGKFNDWPNEDTEKMVNGVVKYILKAVRKGD